MGIDSLNTLGFYQKALVKSSRHDSEWAAAEYIADKLESYGYETEIQEFVSRTSVNRSLVQLSPVEETLNHGSMTGSGNTPGPNYKKRPLSLPSSRNTRCMLPAPTHGAILSQAYRYNRGESISLPSFILIIEFLNIS
jgi:hypothetical protein